MPAATPALSLLVLRSANPIASVKFYELLSLTFTQHRHDRGPEHFAAELPGGAVFEIYPQPPDAPTTLGTRLGFTVASVDATLAALHNYPAAILSPAQPSEWGRRAVLTDPDGHKIELLERPLSPPI